MSQFQQYLEASIKARLNRQQMIKKILELCDEYSDMYKEFLDFAKDRYDHASWSEDVYGIEDYLDDLDDRDLQDVYEDALNNAEFYKEKKAKDKAAYEAKFGKKKDA